jgi:hypothetical protein
MNDESPASICSTSPAVRWQNWQRPSETRSSVIFSPYGQEGPGVEIGAQKSIGFAYSADEKQVACWSKHLALTPVYPLT